MTITKSHMNSATSMKKDQSTKTNNQTDEKSELTQDQQKLEQQVQKVKGTVESMVALLNSQDSYVRSFKGVPIDLRSPLGVESKNN